MIAIIDFLNTVFWGYILIYGLLAVGVFFTLKLGFVQFRHFGEMIRCVIGTGQKDKNGISPFQALTISLASRVGMGNLAGVAVALNLGGPGAIFWMWMVALVGMATAYSESTLAQLYKTHGPDGMYRGGPAYYIAKGLNAPWAGAIFAVALIIAFGLVFSAGQSNAIAEAAEHAFGIPKLVVGLAVAGLSGIVIFGGVRSVAKVAEIIVPVMAGTYLLLAIVVIIMNISEVPGVLGNIVGSAFGLTEATGGIVGGVTAAMLNGIKRGLFSNEAGMGSAPNIAAVATPDPHHPSSQGFVQALGVFIDTLLVCTATAIVILLSGVYTPGGEETGMVLTQNAINDHIGSFGSYFISVAIFFFAFTSIIGNYTYAENSIIYLGAKKPVILVLRAAVLAMVVWGAVQSVSTIFNFADASMGLMATINLIAIVLLSGVVGKLTKDFLTQRKAGKNPTFHIADHPDLTHGVDKEIWK